MTVNYNTFLSDAFLRSHWAEDYQKFKGSPDEQALIERLKVWHGRKDLKETSAEPALLNQFFGATWGYRSSGEAAEPGFTLYPKFSIPGTGAKGGPGEADLALGYFGTSGDVPQVVCEFKDIRSALDAPQKRKDNTRSPVRQCQDYLTGARRNLVGDEPIQPHWGIVTDMNEFRLYWWNRMPQQYMRFVIGRRDLLFTGVTLLDEGEEAQFQRFLFWRVFRPEYLLAPYGKPELLKLVEKQRFREREIENEFYGEYRAFRDRLYNELLLSNPEFLKKRTRGQLLHAAQRILDRCLFIFYCEDMGHALSFPPQLLSEILTKASLDEHFDPKGGDIWERLRGLFRLMNVGGEIGGKKVNRFNGGLFRDDPDIESLRLPNSVFCEPGQGTNAASLAQNRQTLLYLCGSYNYADKGSADKTLGLYTLGHIFEQSITELEIKQAEVEGHESLNKLGKRKTDGVYYTPEWVVETIVSETLEPRLQELRAECGWKGESPSREALDRYWDALKAFKIVDPACGSGAFLITAFRHLRDEFAMVAELRKQAGGKKPLPDEREVVEDILASNIYGVDINPASVEISRLALWLHTARPNEPLSSLDMHIRDGNSLVGKKEFYLKGDLGVFDDERKEMINAFDWDEAFPEVFKAGGFDAVVGNPPYVKLQNFKRIYPEVEEFLSKGRLGKSYYRSTQTGNFDLYLPFIEKGISLLNENGRMGFIAPSLWLVNEYGEGLCRLVHENRFLDRWVDFKSFQVFEEAITYTALQFFSRRPNEDVAFHQAFDGTVGAIDWRNSDNRISYLDLPFEGGWHLLPKTERALIAKLRKSTKRLDDSGITEPNGIFVGIQTSADDIYHLQRVGPGIYRCFPKKSQGQKVAPPPYDVEIEDNMMKPLVSGPEAKRYIEPRTDTYLLFPYETKDGRLRLIPAKDMEGRFPKAWKYLLSYEQRLRARENRKMDDDNSWWSYNYPKNLDKQEFKKLVVAQTVPSMRVCYDDSGRYYLNNVRVNGIVPAKNIDPWALLGALNGSVCDFVFRRIAAPKGGGYFEANKQYIAPLPIPKKLPASIGALAKVLQHQNSERGELLHLIADRLSNMKSVDRPEEWIFPKVGSVDHWLAEAPQKMTSTEKRAWAKERREEKLNAELERVESILALGGDLSCSLDKGELKFRIGGQVAIDKVFVTKAEQDFIFAQWDVLARTFVVTEKTKAKKLVDNLRRLVPAENPGLIEQILDLHRQLVELDTALAESEREINALLYEAYGLTEAEIALVEKG
jgi:hypothetical protein